MNASGSFMAKYEENRSVAAVFLSKSFIYSQSKDMSASVCFSESYSLIVEDLETLVDLNSLAASP